MICNNCNTENEKGAIFCLECGERLPKDNIKQENKSNAESKVSENKDTTTPKSKDSNNEVSPISSAWKDIRSTKSWFVKILLLGLIKCVPVLRWVVPGYAMNYGKGVGTTSSTQMPKGYFDDHSFRNGFFEVIISLLYGLAFSVATIIVGWLTFWIADIGLIFLLALIVFSIFYSSYTCLSAMRGCKDGKIGKSFNIKEIFTAYKKSPGRVFFAYFIPSIICGAIVFIIGIIVLVISATAAAPYIFDLHVQIFQMTSLSNKALQYLLPDILGIISTGSIALIFYWVLSNIVSAFDVVLRYRALGYWIDKYAPEWNK